MNRLKYLFIFITLLSMTLFSMPCRGEGSAIKQLENDFVMIAKKAIPAVVAIKVKSETKTSSSQSGDPFDLFNDDFLKRFFSVPSPKESSSQQYTGQASGFIVSQDGYILTNSHVVEDATDINVILNDGREFKGKLIGQDPNTDIALIKIDAKDLPFLKLGNSDDLQVGQWVVAIGNPLGLQATFTVGVVSATGRNNLDIARIEDFIQTDAAINRGNSGGPLLNLNGDVVGINTAIVSNLASGGYMGIGFAIPSKIAKHDMEGLLADGKVSRGFIGVVVQQVDSNLAQSFGLDKAEGALVSEVVKDSPAQKSGIKQGDIILKLNDQVVLNSGSLRNMISMLKPGSKVLLTVLHKDKNQEQLALEIGDFPNQVANSGVDVSKENKFGFEVQNLSEEEARSLGYGELKGVLISKVNPKSVAAWGGIKKGALIMEINHQPISSVEAFNQEIQKAESNKPLLLLIRQGSATRFVSLTMG